MTEEIKEIKEVEETEENSLPSTGLYTRKGSRPFRLIVKPSGGEYGVFKAFEDDIEPKDELLMRHSLAGCCKGFDLRKTTYDGLYSRKDDE